MKRLATIAWHIDRLGGDGVVSPSRLLLLLDRRPPVSSSRRRGIAGLASCVVGFIQSRVIRPQARYARRHVAPVTPPPAPVVVARRRPVRRRQRQRRQTAASIIAAAPAPAAPTLAAAARCAVVSPPPATPRSRAPIRRVPRLNRRRPSCSIRRAWRRRPSLRGPTRLRSIAQGSDERAGLFAARRMGEPQAPRARFASNAAAPRCAAMR